MGKQIPQTLYDFTDYRLYVRQRIAAMPKQGRGEYRRIATALGMQSSLVSQVFGGDKSLTFEQAALLCETLGLSELETDYFLKLVELDRAGNETLRRILRRQLATLRTRAQEVGERVGKPREMSEEDRALYYSSWIYSGVRLATMIPRYRTLETLAELWRLPRAKVRRALEVLEQRGLVQKHGDSYERSDLNTHVPAGSLLAAAHHRNWRGHVSPRLDTVSDEELAFTSPIALAEKDVPQARALLLEAIEKISKLVEASSPERLTCLNIDWLYLDAATNKET